LERSSALTKLKAKFSNDESRYKFNRKMRMDGAPLTKPIELPKRSAMNKGTNGMEVPLDDDALITNMVAAADATADDTMYRECHNLECIQWSHGERVT